MSSIFEFKIAHEVILEKPYKTKYTILNHTSVSISLMSIPVSEIIELINAIAKQVR